MKKTAKIRKRVPSVEECIERIERLEQRLSSLELLVRENGPAERRD